MSHIDVKSLHLSLSYKKGHSVPVKLTILYSHRENITLLLEFAEGLYWNTKWKFYSEDYGLLYLLYEDLMEIVGRSLAVELSTVFVTSGSFDAANWKEPLHECVKSFGSDKVMQEHPKEPEFDIVFGLKNKMGRQALTLVLKPLTETVTHANCQIAKMQKQIEQNNHEIAVLKQQLRSPEEQMETLMEKKLKEMLPKETVVTLPEPKILGGGPGTFTLDSGMVPENAKKVTLLLHMEKGGGGSNQRFFVKAHTTTGSQKHYHHAIVHHYNNSAWVFDNVEWEFPIGPNHRQVVLETDMVLHGNYFVELYIVGYTV